MHSRGFIHSETVAFAAVLVALASIPLVMDSAADMERFAPKLALMQTAGILGIFALALSPLRQLPKAPLLAAAILLGSSLLSSVFSIDRSRALETAPVFPSDPFNLLCCLSIFLCVAMLVRGWPYIALLGRTIVAVSVPISALVLFQRYGLTTGETAPDSNPLGSFVGGTIYVGGFLVMALPVAIYELSQAHGRHKRILTKETMLWMAIVVLQLSAFFAVEKRGPVMAVCAAALSAAILLGVRRGQYAVIRKGIFGALLVVVFLFLLALGQKQGLPLKEIPGLGRLAMIVPLGGQTGDPLRLAFWEKLPGILDEPLLLPSGEGDAWHPIRPLVGFGPNTVEAVASSQAAFIYEGLRRTTHPSTHNILWDLMLNGGLVAVAAYLGFFLWVFRAGLGRLGMVQPKWVWAAGLAIAGTLLGGAAAALLFSSALIAAGCQAGFLAGVFIPTAFLGRKDTAPTLDKEEALLIALMAALVGHFVDMTFIFPVPSTALLFWVAAGMVINLCSKNSPECDQEATDAGTASVYATAVTGVMLASIAFALTDSNSLTRTIQSAPSLIALFTLTCWLTPLIVASGLPSQAASGIHRQTRFVAVAAAAAILLLIFSPLILLTGGREASEALAPTFQGFTVPLVFMGGVFLVAWITLCSQSGALQTKLSPARRIMIGLLVILAVATVWMKPVRYYRSEVAARSAFEAEDSKASHFFDLALSLRPENFRARLEYADLLAGNPGGAGANHKFEKVLQEGLDISEFNRINARLGEHHLQVADSAKDGEERRVSASKAQQHLARATRYLTLDEESWFNASVVESVFFHNTTKAAAMMAKANHVTARSSNPSLSVDVHRWSHIYTAKALAYGSFPVARQFAQRALDYADRTVEEWPLDKESRFWVLLNRGHALRILGNTERAAASYEEANKLGWEDAPVDPEIYIDLLN